MLYGDTVTCVFSGQHKHNQQPSHCSDAKSEGEACEHVLLFVSGVRVNCVCCSLTVGYFTVCIGKYVLLFVY